MHVVSYDEDHYDTIVDAMKVPKGLAVIGLFFEVWVYLYTWTQSELALKRVHDIFIC